MASRFLVSGGNGNWNSTTNWSDTDGGASGASFPVAADDVIINANSLNAPLIINVVSECRSFSASNYTGTISMDSTLTSVGTAALGNITLSSGMTITGSGTFAKRGTTTTGRITSNGAIFDCNFSFTNTVACTTLIDGLMQVEGNLSSTLNSTVITTINTGIIKLKGNLIHNNPLAGSATIELVGSPTSTITQVATRYLGTNLVINKGVGTFNQVDLYWGANSRTLTYTSGIINHTGVLFTANATSATINTNGMNWNTLEVTNSVLFTSIFNANRLQRTTTSVNNIFGGTHGFNINYVELISTGNGGNFQGTVGGLVYKINNSLIFTVAGGVNGQIRSTGLSNINLELSENAFMKLHKVNMLKITATKKTLRTLSGTVDSGVSQNVFTLSSNINPYSTTR